MIFNETGLPVDLDGDSYS